VKRSVRIIFNSGIRKENKNLYISSKYKDFLSELSMSEDVYIKVVGSLGDSSNQFSDYCLDENFEVETLKKVPLRKSFKVLYYLNVCVKSFLRKHESFSYIFFPGNLAISMLPGMMLRNNKYALYLRGEVRYKNIFLNYLTQKILKKAQFIIATGKNTANFAKQFNDNVEEVVPMMSVSKENLYRRENYDLSTPTKILFFSRVEKDKGIYEAVEAVKNLINEGYDIQFDIAGGGTKQIMEELEEITKPIKDKTFIHGQISENKKIQQLFRKADVYVFPSYYPEGFPRVLYEAMAFGTPIIVADIPPVEGTMIDNENCLKVPPQSSLELKNAIKTLINDEELRKKIGTNGYQFMEKFFEKIDGDSHAKQVLRWIEKTKKSD